MQILEVKDVTKYYGSGAVVAKALDGVSFTVDSGEFVAIMGASGSGKSTLLNVIATIDHASAGTIAVAGKPIDGQKEEALCAYRRDQLGFVFQDYNLLDTLTVGENIVLPLHLQRMAPQKAEKELQRVAEALGVTDQLSKFPYALSGGQRQRAACARAIITNPALVLADEPTGALDSANSANLMKTFLHMNQYLRSTILMVTHDPLVGSYAGRVLFLKDGKIWTEILRGKRTQQEMYGEILSVMAALGGEAHVR